MTGRDTVSVEASGNIPKLDKARQHSRRNFLSSLAATTILPLPTMSFAQGATVSDRPLGSEPIRLSGYYSGHLQGFCTDKVNNIYWSMTTCLVKTSVDGLPIISVTVPNHHGDCCYLDGKIYVAVNLGRFNDPEKKSDSWIYVYNSDDLGLLAKHQAKEVIYGAGGIAYAGNKFLVVGGLPTGLNENCLYEYDKDLNFIREIRLSSGYTFLGVQTVTYGSDHWWLGCYGYPEMTLKVSKDFRKIQKFSFDSCLGIEQLNDHTYLVADGSCSKTQGCLASIRPSPLDKWISEGVLRPLDNRIVGRIPPWR